MTGDTKSTYLQCGIYLKAIRLRVEEDYSQEHKIAAIFNIFKDIMKNHIRIESSNDMQIKNIMNNHKKVTFIEVKKLFLKL